jgi:hypothetical protein
MRKVDKKLEKGCRQRRNRISKTEYLSQKDGRGNVWKRRKDEKEEVKEKAG